MGDTVIYLLNKLMEHGINCYTSIYDYKNSGSLSTPYYIKLLGAVAENYYLVYDIAIQSRTLSCFNSMDMMKKLFRACDDIDGVTFVSGTYNVETTEVLIRYRVSMHESNRSD